MTAAVATIRQALEQVDRQVPELRIINTKASCMTLLQLALDLAGPEFEYVGKVASMDGAYALPPGFKPFDLELVDPQGVRRTVTIAGVSMDACYHRPTGRQIKAITFSTANEPGDHEKGPAKFDSYEIETKHYRWHNPPVPRPGASTVPTAPPMTVIVPPARPLVDYHAMGDDAFFNAAIGATLEADMALAGQGMNAGSAGWIARTVFRVMRSFDRYGDHRETDAIVRDVRNQWRSVLRSQNPSLQLPPF